MSIHPEYAEAIMRGDKRVEFRKRRLAPDIDTVVVYATAPVQRVVGTFAIERTVAGDPESVWREVGAVGGISRETFDNYYARSPQAVGLVVKSARRCRPAPLSDLGTSLVPPQSFAYIPETLVPSTVTEDVTTVTRRAALTFRGALRGAIRAIVGLGLRRAAANRHAPPGPASGVRGNAPAAGSPSA
jgi:predicted transcriptional regulator